jgi:ABC-2 type transport system ATP-binding protein
MEMVEELCESLVIIDRGRIVVGGSVREVRRATGRQVVRLGVMGDGDLPWLAELDGVQIIRPGQDYTELYVEAGRDPESILDAARARGEHISRFEIGDPSIEQIFIDHVGPVPLEEKTLAARSEATSAAAAPAGGPPS